MTDGVRHSLGLLCIAVLCGLVSLGAGGQEAGSEAEGFFLLARGIGALLAVVGLGMLAWNLMRPTR